VIRIRRKKEEEGRKEVKISFSQTYVSSNKLPSTCKEGGGGGEKKRKRENPAA